MLIEFTVGNYKSFSEKVCLDLRKTSIRELPENVIETNFGFDLLKSAVVYGSNAGGKSNLIESFFFMFSFAIDSFKNYKTGEYIKRPVFVFNEENRDKPSFFEIVISVEGKVYRYGFEINDKIIIKEWLYQVLKTKDEKLFIRSESEFDLSKKFSEGADLKKFTRDNCTFLSVTSQFNGKISSEIVKWFSSVIGTVRSHDIYRYHDNVILRLKEDEKLKDRVLKFVNFADNAIKGIEFKNRDKQSESGGVKNKSIVQSDETENEILFKHNIFNSKGKISGTAFLPYENFESEGTQKMLSLAVPVFDALSKGTLLIFDEFESHLHSLLVRHIIKIFNSDMNDKGAQLIITTHNLTCLQKDCFRRDQIWFVEKNTFGESGLFALSDYKDVRNDSSYSKDYLLGKYGAIPFIDEVDTLYRGL